MTLTNDNEETVIPPRSDVGTLRHHLGLLEASASPRRARVTVVGHRGAVYHQLENTIQGFIQCAQWGCDAIELDVFALKDSSDAPTLVVFHGHDAHPRGPGGLAGYCLNEDDTPNGGRTIWDLTHSEVESLRLNPNHAEFPCPPDRVAAARIPTLHAVLTALQPYPMHIKIELKGPSVALVRPLVELVERLDMVDRCSYSSFDLTLLRELRTLRPSIATGALFTAPTPVDYIQQAQQCHATQVHLRYDECTVSRVHEIRAAHMTSMAWTRGPVGMTLDQDVYSELIREGEGPLCYQALLDTGVDEICCNKPDVLLDMLS